MSSLFTSLLGGNLIANNQASSTANLLGQNAEYTLGEMQNQNGILSSQEQLFNSLYAQISGQASSILGQPVLNAGKLMGLGKKVNPTGAMGDQTGISTARQSLLGA